MISPDEVAIVIMGRRAIPNTNDEERAGGTGVNGANPGQEPEWGPSGTREKPTGLGIVNMNPKNSSNFSPGGLTFYKSQG